MGRSILNVAVHGRQLSTQGPKSNQPLPMDDDDWDRLVRTSRAAICIFRPAR